MTKTNTPPKAPAAAQPFKAAADGINVWCAYQSIVPVDILQPNSRNPNTHSRRQIELLAKNIRHFGWRHPITVSTRSHKIVAGHARHEAARLLGLKTVPVDYQSFASDEEELAILISDNRLAELASIDLNSLDDIIADIQTAEFDTILTGYEPADLEALLHPQTTANPDANQDQEITPGVVKFTLGGYRFAIPQDDYLHWLETIKQDVGFDETAILAELRRRLAL